MGKSNLSVVLATKNEEKNIGPCLESIKKIADEIVVVDEESTDKTVEIAKKYNAAVYSVKHEPIFHKTKQKAIDHATGNWILQLDADERVSPELAKEIESVVRGSHSEFISKSLEPREINIKVRLFMRHQKLISARYVGKKKAFYNQEVYPERSRRVAFFIPRRNFFLGKPLIHAGVYPDGSIRLIKQGCARLPGKSVHEVMEVDGEIGWLFNDLEHHESPTFNRYLDRMNRYTDLHAVELKQKKVGLSILNLLNYSFLLPTYYFLLLYFRHKGILDGMRGFVWSAFSALHYPLAYFKYYQSVRS